MLSRLRVFVLHQNGSSFRFQFTAMRPVLLFVAVFFFQQLFAQTPDREDYNIWRSDDSIPTYYVSANKAMVRQTPSTDGILLDSLLLGDKLLQREITKTYSTIRGIYAPWIKVDYEKNGQQRSGYVWIGLLGFQSLVKNDTVFVYGLEKVRSSKAETMGFEETKYTISLKAISNNSLIAFKEWTIAGDESASYVVSKKLGDMGLKNTHEILRISLGGEACGIPTNYYYHGWDGKRLYDLPGKYEVGDAGVYYHTETLLFPNEKGGKPGLIIKLVEEEALIQEETATQKEKFKKTNKKDVYAWNGEKATRIK